MSPHACACGAFALLLMLSCTDRCVEPEDSSYQFEVCGCERHCIAAVTETPVHQLNYYYHVCVSKLDANTQNAPRCCASNYSSVLCEEPYLSSCEGDTVLERYDVDLGQTDACAPMEIKLPTIEDDRTGGNPVLVVLSGINRGPVNYCAVIDLRRSVAKYGDIVTIHGNSLAPQPGFDPPPACPNAVEGPALNDPPPDGGM